MCMCILISTMMEAIKRRIWPIITAQNGKSKQTEPCATATMSQGAGQRSNKAVVPQASWFIWTGCRDSAHTEHCFLPPEAIVRAENRRWHREDEKNLFGMKSQAECPTCGDCQSCLKCAPVGTECEDCSRIDNPCAPAHCECDAKDKRERRLINAEWLAWFSGHTEKAEEPWASPEVEQWWLEEGPPEMVINERMMKQFLLRSRLHDCSTRAEIRAKKDWKIFKVMIVDTKGDENRDEFLVPECVRCSELDVEQEHRLQVATEMPAGDKQPERKRRAVEWEHPSSEDADDHGCTHVPRAVVDIVMQNVNEDDDVNEDNDDVDEENDGGENEDESDRMSDSFSDESSEDGSSDGWPNRSVSEEMTAPRTGVEM